ncbi:hypothetical protein GJAV_G00004660 [Gymnothorax javanicus]|nr:hypothetical protein GJAV_G00004660 [Gymnothorax javanicus]
MWDHYGIDFRRPLSYHLFGNLNPAEMQARSTDNLDSSGEPTTRSVGTTANLKGKMSKRLSIVKGHFPKLVDCAHFHYDTVDFGTIELQFASDQSDASWTAGSAKDLVFLVQVSCQGKTWMVRRSYEEFRTLDAHLHQCIYDRRYSQLLPLPALSEIGDRVEILTPLLSEYLSRLSMIVDNKLNCGPVLTWMEIDNRGNRFLLKEEASLNVPAIAAAHVIKRYTAQASDEISIEVGDILSVIDMPPKEDTSWWRGKHGFQVGFFPSECVELINERVSQSVNAPSAKLDGDAVGGAKPSAVSVSDPSSPSSVSKKHGKLMGFLRTFMKSRPTKQKLKQRGILKERVFGCDLGEHLLNSGHDVPQVLKSCSEFIEKYGIVDGIYRHSGVSSNIQKLRHEFDSENVPDLTKDTYMQDIHCVGSLCKLYFRELPNPLLTYQLYDKFADCMGEMTEDERLVKVHDVIQQLPPPHYRTLEFLMKHLAHLATYSGETNMHIKNLAIVWAPNLLRSMEIEAVGLSGADPFKEVRIQSVVVEFLLSNVEVLFSDSFTSVGRFNSARSWESRKIRRSYPRNRLMSLQEAQGEASDRRSLTRPKSFVSTRLLSLEEAQARTQAPLLLQGVPLSFQGKFHTVLDLPPDRRKRGLKVRKSAGGSWKTFFAIGKPAGSGRRKPMRISSLFQPTTSHAGCRVDSVTLRSAKSEESLSSQHSGPGQGKLQRLRRPRSSSDGLALAGSLDPQLLPPSRSYDSLLPEESRDRQEGQDEEEEEDEEDEEGVYMLPDFSQDPASSWMAEDVIDFSPTFLEDGPIGLGGGGGGGASGGRESPPAATPPPYRCVGHPSHAHSRTQSQRSITEDPDSVLNQSEAAARRSLILAAAAPPVQVYCQHRPPAASASHPAEPSGSPSHGQPLGPSAAQPPPERRSFTRKVVHALSPKAPKSPPLDISDPIAISVPAKVLEMIGGRAGELQPGTQGASSSQPPQMISMLLRSCDFQLTESCQQEIRSKLGPDPKVKGFMLPSGPSLPSQQPPPPPPKNPARLMALALAESANKALRQGASPPYRPPQPPQPKPAEPLESRFTRSVSVDSSSPTDPNQLYSTVRPLSVWMSEGESNPNANTAASEIGEQQSGRSPGQDTGTLSSDTSVSDSGGSHSEVTGSSSSGDTDSVASPVYKNQEEPLSPPPAKPGPPPFPEDREPPAQRKPPAYNRQYSAPHLQHKGAPQGRSPPQPHPQLLHSKSECSPLAQVRAFQPTRPKVPPKPLELAPARAAVFRADNYMRRSLDAARIRRLITQSQSGPPGGPPNPPLSRAFSERLSGTSGYRPSHPAPQPAHIRPVPTASSSTDDQGKVENFYYEISGPEHPQAPPSYAWHSYQNMRLEAEGNYRPSPGEVGQRPLSRSHAHPLHAQGAMVPRAPQLWSSEATRAWAAAHSHSHSFSHGHSHSHPHPLPHRHASSSVRLSRNEMHPALMGSSPVPSALPLSVHKPQRGGVSHVPHRAPSADLTSSQLHPYFENGRVCYRYFEASQPAEDHPAIPRPSAHPLHPLHKPSVSSSPPPPPPPKQPPPPLPRDQPEPIYVNFPFTSPPASTAKTWLTTDLDASAKQPPESLAPPPEVEPASPLLAEQESPGGPESVGYESPPRGDTAKDVVATKPTSVTHYRSRSDPQSSGAESRLNSGAGPGLSGKDIASLLIEKLAEDEGDDPPSAPTSSSASSSPEHPPNPYPSQQQLPPAYNVYTPSPSQAGPPKGGSVQRQDALRRSSSSGSGQYRQAFDVMPSGDQVLKFYRSQDSLGENPYPSRPLYQDPPYPNPHSSIPPSDAGPRGAPHMILGPPRGYGGTHMGGFHVAPPPQYSHYQFQSVPMLSQYPNTPRREGPLGDPSLRPPPLQNPRGLTRQGSLPGPNWTIHTEGQTRSYC